MKEMIYNQGVKINTPVSNSFVYCWENLINGKKYIGQTKQGIKRLNDEENMRNVYGAFRNALIKYGQINFNCYILEYCEVELLDEKEKFWIKKLNSHYSENGYNLTWGGQNGPVVTYISTKTKKLYENKETIPEDEFDHIYKYDLINEKIGDQVLPFYAFNKNGEILKKFISMKDALNFCNTKNPFYDNIARCLAKKQKSAYGYLWSYNENEECIYKPSNHKQIAKYDFDGQLVDIYPTVTAAADSINTTLKSLSTHLNRKEEWQLHGFMWRYVDENFELEIKPYLDQIPFKIIQYDLNKNKLKEYASIEEASQISGVSRTRISLACNGHIEHTRKHYWEKHYNNK